MRRILHSTALCCFLFVVSLSQAQSLPFAMDAPTDGAESYDRSIPTPESVIGHVIGTKHTVPHEVEAYFRAVAGVSDRVTLDVHARSYEGRNLIHAIVTSPANHARLDEILAMQQRVADDPASVSDADLADMPVVLYQGYSVHGNEASGTEASLLYLYHLAAGQGSEIDEALDSAIILIVPMFNPDGRDRFGDWVNRNRGGVATNDPQDREHNEPWPGGRTNHYWFDLNRDWMVAQHPESKGRIELFHTWRPHILTDHHEMGGNATFFFQPGIPTRNNPNTPVLNIELTARIGTYHARGLDAVGSAYYSEESYDDFFLGKGSAFPDVNGGVGILFEQASSRALIGAASDGDLHYAFTVLNQYVTSLTTLHAGIGMRQDMLRYQRDFYLDALEEASKSKTKAWVLDMADGRTRAQMFMQTLQRHRVEFYALTKDVTVGGRTVRAGQGAVVPANQLQFKAIKSFTERTLVYEDSLFYDVSTWTLPLAFDVDFLEMTSSPDGIIGDELMYAELDGGRLYGGTDGVAYLLRWDRLFAPRTVFRLQQAGIPLRLAHQPFTALVDGEEVSFDRGSVIIPFKGRDMPGMTQDLNVVHEIIQTAVREDHVSIYSADTGLTPMGPDLGGSSTSTLRPVQIALAAGSGLSSGSAGEAWHAMGERFRLPVSLIEPSSLGRADLSRYSVIVLPGGSYSADATESLKAWTRSGGTLVMLSGMANWAGSQGLFDVESQTVDIDSLLEGLPYHLMDEARGAQGIGGSIFEVSLDTTHPLAYGLPERLPVLRQGSSMYTFDGSDAHLVGQYSDQPLLSGYLSEEKAAQLAGGPAVLAGSYGQGNTILFMDRLNFRAYWVGSQRLFFNALFFGGAF